MINLQTQKHAQSWVKRPQLRQLSHDLSTKLSTSETQRDKLAAKLRFRTQKTCVELRRSGSNRR